MARLCCGRGRAEFDGFSKKIDNWVHSEVREYEGDDVESEEEDKAKKAQAKQKMTKDAPTTFSSCFSSNSLVVGPSK